MYNGFRIISLSDFVRRNKIFRSENHNSSNMKATCIQIFGAHIVCLDDIMCAPTCDRLLARDYLMGFGQKLGLKSGLLQPSLMFAFTSASTSPSLSPSPSLSDQKKRLTGVIKLR